MTIATNTTTCSKKAKSSTTSNDDKNDNPEDVLNVNVGILGHVDSGKTSLVKTLSTLLSTAALDKSKQSRQRGMTLDLGFSCFFLPLPEHLQAAHPTKSKLQMTLVDCPGHASLIKTIIGGAQIIDMVLLIVDAYKGWQAQTTECLVLAELTSPHLIVALNKIDMFAPHERELKLQEAKRHVWKRLANTRFKTATLVGVSACVGGEKEVASTAVGTNNDATSATKAAKTTKATKATKTTTTTAAGLEQKNETLGVDVLIQTLQRELPIPKRSSATDDTFYFSIDHCFPIRGQGTVLTGTVLSGSLSVNQMVEFPTLGRLERKVKSMQMFRRKLTKIQQGDRAGICLSNLDPTLLERGICATPGAVRLLKGAIAVVRKVTYFPGTLKGGSKFHISVGHTTVMATVTFWGARELLAKQRQQQRKQQEQQQQEQQQEQQQQQQQQQLQLQSTKESAEEAPPSKNKLKDSKQQQQQKLLLGHTSLGGDANIAGLPRWKFDFDQTFLQQESLLESLSSEEDDDNHSNNNNNDNNNLLHWAMIDFQTPVYCPLDSLIIGSRLDVEADASSSSCRLAFSGRLVEKIDPAVDGLRLKLYVPKEKRGIISKLGDAFQRADDGQIVRYELFGDDLFKKETNMKLFTGMTLLTPSGEVGEIKGSYGTAGKFRVWFPGGTTAKEGDELLLKFKRYVNDDKKEMRQDGIMELPAERVGTRIEIQPKSKNKKKQTTTNKVVVGQVSALKGDVLESNGKHTMAIIAGLFSPEVNIRERAGAKIVIPSTSEQGKIVGPFGKAGKCKVSFEQGISAEVGTKAELHS